MAIYIYIGFGPLPVRVTTRIIFFVGNRYKPLFANKYLDLPKGEWMMFGVPMPKTPSRIGFVYSTHTGRCWEVNIYLMGLVLCNIISSDGILIIG